MKKLLLILVLSTATNVLVAQLKVHPNGYVSILSTSTPINPLHFFGGTMRVSYLSNKPLLMTAVNSDPRIQTSSGGKIVFYNTANNNWVDIQVRAVHTMSDAKLKTHVKGISQNQEDPLLLIKKLNGVEFSLKDESTGKKYAGFVAQELEKVLPHLVSTDDSIGNKSINYQAIIPYLVEAIKQQQSQIETLKEKLNIKESISFNSNSTFQERENSKLNSKSLAYLEN